MIKVNKNAKLVLLVSSYTDLNSYKNYFSKIDSAGVSILKIPKINFPVTTVWKKELLTPLDDYISNIVHTILGILVLHDHGDILAFLPDLHDLKKTAGILKKQLIKLQLYEVDYYLVYENAIYALDYKILLSSKRTVFLSSDCAEETVFPSVRFVVDCGIKKVKFYDSDAERDIPKLTFISCQRAKLRKTLAGDSNPGICYRIYSKKNYYLDMPKKDYPEILRVNPYNTIIQIFHYRFGKYLKSDFIEFFSENIQYDIIKDLQKLEVLKSNSVTALGRNIMNLPFHPKYSKLILLALEQGLAFEAVILIAFFANKQNIFVHSDNEKQQRIIDVVKFQLTMNESDTFTYLYLYKNWMKVGFNVEFCKKYFLNPDVMNKINVCVFEICSFIKSCLGKKIKESISDLKNCYLHLTEILLQCFHQNLCVYTGHSKSGYRVLSSFSVAFIHPTSVVNQMENTPQFILYNHIMLDKNNLLHITAIPSDLIMKALGNNVLQFSHEDLFEKTLTCRVIEPVGEEVMNEMLLGSNGTKLKSIEEQIRKETGSDLIFLEVFLSKGCVNIYALPNSIDCAQCVVEDMLKNKFDYLLNEQNFEILELNYNQNKISFLMDWSKGAVAISLRQISQEESINTFHEINNDTDTFMGVCDSPYFPYQLCFAWIRRPCSGKAYVNFSDEENFTFARKLALRYINIFGFELFFQISNKRENQLCISGLPPEINVNDLKQELQLLTPYSKIDSIQLEYIQPFKTSDNDLISLRSMIADVCQEFITLGEFDVTIPNPDPKDLDMIAYIDVFDNEFLNPISEVLSTIVTTNKKFITKILYNLIIKCDKELCKVLKPVIIFEMEQMEHSIQNSYESKTDCLFGIDIDLDSEEKALIKISSSNNEILSLIHRKINDLMAGELLNSESIKDLENIFFYGGQIWLENLAKSENVRIVINNKMKTLILYGSPNACDNVKCQIAIFLEDAKKDIMQQISLTTEQSGSMLMKTLIREYGVNLEQFIQNCDLRSAHLDIKAHQLLIRGSEDSVGKAEETIKTLSDNLDVVIPDVGQLHEICPVCYCPAYNLTFRLEHCGHLYCLECIQALVEQAQFPIHCCFGNCSKDIVVKDIQKILKDDHTKIKTLLEKSMKDFLERKREFIYHCPAPDCSMFFYKDQLSDSKVHCPLCKNDICSKCNVLYHGGYTCDMYQNTKKDPDYSFKVWQKTNVQCKQCPKCKTAIEKIAGCNRMRCSTCKISFCWICLEAYTTDQQVYNHIHSAHRGMLFT
ncbi:ATP-dependent RNA helicase DEAH12, chloroplastic [Caerostris darwini]|uniref:ATP-dependent RNA helicase DEAH12, chloroplastic n=1 Tax=Caerostris darwini TaxID=1538125 RepID=A0AAV4M5J5_9ARAC|nr:ATP-dependent RNA helicase DEAH12, chloroplastic [Caerostris darwini]